jgi:hypothetical protein
MYDRERSGDYRGFECPALGALCKLILGLEYSSPGRFLAGNPA